MTLSKTDIEAIGALLDSKLQVIDTKWTKHLDNFNFLVARIYEIDEAISNNERRLLKLECAACENELIIFNMEDTGSTGENLLIEIMHVIHEKLDNCVDQMWMNDAYRIGQRMTGKNRPIILRTASRRIVNTILQNVSKLKGSPIIIRQNRPYAMQQVMKKFKEEIKTAYAAKKKVGWKGPVFMIDGVVKHEIGRPRLHQQSGDMEVRRRYRTSTPCELQSVADTSAESMMSQARDK
jgi:hypothetical protein